MALYKLGESFKWFIARVIDIKDELKLGRVKIRVIHDQTGELGSISNKQGIIDDDLLWAYPISAIQSSSLNYRKINELEFDGKEFVPDWIDAVGLSPTGIAIGTYVYGFYLDGHEQNIPLIFGTYHKKSRYPEPPTDGTGKMLQVAPGDGELFNDVAKLAQGENTLDSEKKKRQKQAKYLSSTTEPNSAYDTDYPYNLTYTTKRGHAIELDDTQGKERIHLYHSSGSYEEISNSADFTGRRVKKTVGDNYEVVDQNKNVLVIKNSFEEIQENCTVVIGENHTVTVHGNGHIHVDGTATISCDHDIKIKAPGGVTIVDGSVNLANGALTVESAANGVFSTPDGRRVVVQKGIVTKIE